MMRLGRHFDSLLNLMGAASAVLLALITVGITAEIFVRGLGVGSLPWIIEAVEYALLGVTFLSAPWVLKQSAHVRVDIVVENLGPRMQKVALVLGNAIGVVVCAVILYFGLKSTIRLYDLETRIFKVMIVKEWWLFALIPLSCALMIVEFLRRMFRGSMASPADEDRSSQPDRASF